MRLTVRESALLALRQSLHMKPVEHALQPPNAKTTATFTMRRAASFCSTEGCRSRSPLARVGPKLGDRTVYQCQDCRRRG